MGLMAVFALVLVMLLWLQSKTNQDLAREKAATEAELAEIAEQRQRLEEERSQFALELLSLIDTTYQIVQTQDQAEDWIRHLFEEHDCLLVLSPDGALELEAEEGGAQSAALHIR